MFCWDLGHSNVIDSIMFTKEFDEMLYCATNAESFKWDIVLECKGASIVRCCQMVVQVMSGKIPMTFDSVNKAIDDEAETKELLPKKWLKFAKSIWVTEFTQWFLIPVQKIFLICLTALKV